MRTDYLVWFAQIHAEFRIPELLSMSELYNFSIHFPGPVRDLDTSRPFMIFALDEEEHAKILARRCILIKSICEFYATGSNYPELHEGIRSERQRWARFISNTSFKFSVIGYNHTIPQRRQREAIESFSYMGFLGDIDLENPEIVMSCFEEYPNQTGAPGAKYSNDGKFKQVYFGRLVADGSARQLVQKFDIKKRLYYGNTSMDAEISLLMANQTLASPGKLMYDPFVGTGSMAYTTAYWGSMFFGSDIDGRQMRGKGNSPGIIGAAGQYGVASRIVDLCAFDITHNPWRCGDIFDAIVTDPPYGVRAGAKRLGRKKDRLKVPIHLPRPDDQPYIPPTKPYELSQLVSDLVLLARYMLKPGGRLVFFLPTVSEEYEEIDIATMLCDGMEVVANSLQDFGSWGRRLITIGKMTAQSFPAPPFADKRAEIVPEPGPGHVPAHKDFRQKYFQGFKRPSDSG